MRSFVSWVLGGVACSVFVAGCGSRETEPEASMPPEPAISQVSQRSVVPPTLTITECNPNPAVPTTLTVTGKASPPENYGTAYRGTVLAPNQVFHKGTVVVDKNGIIACVGCTCSIPTGYATLAWTKGVISPGLINTHDHLA